MPYLSFLFICLVWGASFILMERSSAAMGPLEIGIGRLLGGAAVLALVWWLRRHPFRITASDWKHIIAVSFLANALPFVIQPYVIAQGCGHSFIGMFVALVPLATILVSIPMLGIWPTVWQVAGVLGGLACMTVIFWEGFERGMTVGLLLLALFVPIIYAWGNTYIKWKLKHLPALPLSMLFLATAGVALLPLELFPSAAAALDLAGPAQPQGWPLAIASLLFLGVVGTGITILLFIRLILDQGPLFAGMVTYVVPIFALFWGRFDNETITPQQIAAMTGVLAMVALVQFGAPRPEMSPTAPESSIAS